MRFLFFGMGYSSLACANFIRNELSKDIKITGTIRNNENANRLLGQNIKSIIFDGEKTNHSLNEEIKQASHIIISIAPNEMDDVVFNHYQQQIEKAKNLKWICYFSTVGVYGNQSGALTDESAKCQPVNLRSIERLKAEKLWCDFADRSKIPLLILRLSGIYGEGRSSFDKLKNGTAKRIIKQGQVFNRIHVKDIARATILAAQQNLNGTFNLSDDEPAPPQDVVSFAANILGQKPPPEIAFEEANMSKMARSFYNDNKRVSNNAIKQVLDIELLYPTYRQGLNAIYRSDS